jgi:hypothetical protein
LIVSTYFDGQLFQAEVEKDSGEGQPVWMGDVHEGDAAAAEKRESGQSQRQPCTQKVFGSQVIRTICIGP